MKTIQLTRVVVYSKKDPTKVLAMREGKNAALTQVEAVSFAMTYYGSDVGRIQVLSVVKDLKTGNYISVKDKG